jgi:hypothetical protein
MAKGKSKTPDSSPVDMRPGLTPEAEENQCIAMAYRLVKQRLADGSASSQETTHFLKMGSIKARLENEKLKEENKLLQAKTKALESAEDMKGLYAEAIKAMALYQGHGDPDDDEEY